jgi:hypothetical protein
MLAAVLGFAVLSMAQADYVMYKTMYLKPKYDKLKELGKAMAEHNKEYHSEGTGTVYVWLVNTGPHTGEWLIVSGPTTFTDMDNIDYGQEHQDHWLFEVMPYVEDVSEGEYWRMDAKTSYNPEDAVGGKEVLSIYEVRDFEEYRFNDMLKKVKEVYEQKAYPNFFQVYHTQFDSFNGRDVLIAGNFPNWAFFDRERTFKKDYEEVHGEGSWSKLMEEYKDCVVSSYDEVIIYIPELSGPASE